MESIAIPKFMLAILLVASVLVSVVGVSYIYKFVPATGIAPYAVLRDTATTSSLQDFVKNVKNGRRNEVVGVFVPGVLALAVGQQPQGNAGFVTRMPNEATQFNLAGQYGTIGLLAHNDLAGADFSEMSSDEYAIIVYGDGHLEYFLINEVQKYQALSPTSTFSDFIDLDGSNEKLSASQLFNRVYGPGGRLVFQTCIDANGDPSWGRMFIIAEPADNQVLSVVNQTSFLMNFASFGLAVH